MTNYEIHTFKVTANKTDIAVRSESGRTVDYTIDRHRKAIQAPRFAGDTVGVTIPAGAWVTYRNDGRLIAVSKTVEHAVEQIKRVTLATAGGPAVFAA